MEKPEDETSQEESGYAYEARDQLAASAAQATEYNADPANVPASVATPVEGETQAEGADKGAFMEAPQGDDKGARTKDAPKTEDRGENKTEDKPQAAQKPPAAAPAPPKPPTAAQAPKAPAKPPTPAQQPAKLQGQGGVAAAKAKAEETVTKAEETVKAVDQVEDKPAQSSQPKPPAPPPAAPAGPAQAPTPPTPPGTKDTALETHVTDAEAGGSTSS